MTTKSLDGSIVNGTGIAFLTVFVRRQGRIHGWTRVDQKGRIGRPSYGDAWTWPPGKEGTLMGRFQLPVLVLVVLMVFGAGGAQAGFWHGRHAKGLNHGKSISQQHHIKKHQHHIAHGQLRNKRQQPDSYYSKH